MLRTCGKEDRWLLFLEDTPLLEHSGEAPFATAIRREKTYSANRGTVKEHITEVERLPLTGVSEAEGTVTFFRGDHCLRMTVSPCDGAAAAADRAVEALAAALKAAVYLLDPGKLILYGAIFEHPYYLSRLRAEMEIGVDRAHATPLEKSAYNGTLEYAAAGLLAAERFLTNGGFRE